MKQIISAYFRLIIFNSGLLPKKVKEELAEMRNKRLSICATCPLMQNGWCSKKKAVPLREYREGVLIITKIRGCGCWLKAKSLSEPYKNICPLYKW